MPAKPKVGFFSFTSCEGCQLTVLEMEEILLDLVSKIDVVNFREASSYKGEDYEIAFVEGSITREEEVELIKKIRDQVKVLVAIGACATSGGLNYLKNFHPLNQVRKTVYGDQSEWFDTLPVRPVHELVKVDYFVYGCPMVKEEFLELVTSLLIGKTPNIPRYPVCVECKMKENACLYWKGRPCLGPMIRAGCGAICPTYGQPCEGCRGLSQEFFFESLSNVMMESGMSLEEISSKLRLYNGNMEEKLWQTCKSMSTT